MNLWDLDIETIPCGWEDIYQEALRENPDGCIIRFEEIAEDDKRYFYHPVKYRRLLIETFNKVKNQANNLVKNRDTKDLNDFINGLVNADAILFNLLVTWTYDSSEYDGSSFDPRNFYKEEVYSSFESYFSDYDDFSYADLRLVKQTSYFDDLK